jgi:hypothetical protein
MNDPFRIKSVEVHPGQSLRLTFEDGYVAAVNLSQWIADTRALSRLHDPVLFAKAHPGEWGATVSWIDDDLELGADNLRNLAIEQSGGIGHERILEWMHQNQLTQERAADAIGMSRRMLNYYLSGTKTVPKTVWLACKGWEVEREAAHA